jgi:hypothetical protein
LVQCADPTHGKGGVVYQGRSDEVNRNREVLSSARDHGIAVIGAGLQACLGYKALSHSLNYKAIALRACPLQYDFAAGDVKHASRSLALHKKQFTTPVGVLRTGLTQIDRQKTMQRWRQLPGDWDSCKSHMIKII